MISDGALFHPVSSAPDLTDDELSLEVPCLRY
jgi:hypothetical protein